MATRFVLGIWLILSLLIQVSAAAQPDTLNPNTRLPNHPRLLLLKGEEAALRRTLAADPVWQRAHQAILAECDAMLPLAPVERIQIGRRLLDKSREALRRIFFLSYAWRLTQQETYLKRAEKELLAVCAFSDWNPSHFLDVAEMTLGVSIGYDWLYDGLSATSRERIREAILQKGITPSLDANNNSWLRASHNWNQVCNAGITFGAMAIYEDKPQLANRLINRAIRSVVLPMHDYAPDGAYPEGYSYWGYGTSFNVLLVSALEKSFGRDFGLARQPGFLATARYLQHMTGPTGLPFNYSDAGTNSDIQPAMFWFAQKQNDPTLLWVERGRLEAGLSKRNMDERLLPAMMIWSNGIRMAQIKPPVATAWAGQGRNPVAMLRTSWTNPNALFLALKAGSPSVNHAHMDVGSFVMEADGVRWAMDLGMQSYESLESKGVKLWDMRQQSQRWAIFRYNNLAHNTLTVNDSLQRMSGKAVITNFSDNPAFGFATTDLGELYKGQLTEAKRGVALMDKAYVAIRDELTAPGAETTVRWTMVTPATVKLLGGNQAELTQNGKTLRLEVAEPARIALKTWPTDPPHAYDAPNPNTTRIGFEVKLPPHTRQSLTVLLLPASAKAIRPVPPLAQWGK